MAPLYYLSALSMKSRVLKLRGDPGFPRSKVVRECVHFSTGTLLTRGATAYIQTSFVFKPACS